MLFPNAVNLTDPSQIMRCLAAAATAAGVRLIVARANRIERIDGGVHVSGDAFGLIAKAVVIAAGAQSKPLAAQAGDHVPLDTERGYHVEFDMQTPQLSRPVCPTARGFYLVPMSGRLRVAGTVAACPLLPIRIGSHCSNVGRATSFLTSANPIAPGSAFVPRCRILFQ